LLVWSCWFVLYFCRFDPTSKQSVDGDRIIFEAMFFLVGHNLDHQLGADADRSNL